MNFLSHYYFDRNVTDCYFILGTVLPDLLKNADKTIVLHPEKLQHPNNQNVNSLIAGWNKHLEVDRHFHSSDFFKTHSHQLKKELLPAIQGSPVKPFFLGHIAVELILDNLLITTGKLSVDSFYAHLSSCTHSALEHFFGMAGLKDPSIFLRYFEKFKKDQYLHTYAEPGQITYALKRICMRVWQDPFTPQHEAGMTEIIENYRTTLLTDFMLIFSEITKKMDTI
ncbi:hypothetical protein [Mucilaginibacter auburnensis]|uniref:Acyl carrier protein phosphodiesterase n=1 Tax=Mucilaginibacter auburnensis TaxID=1457233 RepID=A0A2H9VMR2_9SPHI|nr:hypothetical protein [Mucilaginibacter auburnensis]PJJ79612.1 hypothetical protein CLV57_2746 [Mucilaginibacter auburnensis]